MKTYKKIKYGKLLKYEKIIKGKLSENTLKKR